ncbi:hypothetical protein U1Q18_024126 [Sarracenia purpurea var. burkii]
MGEKNSQPAPKLKTTKEGANLLSKIDGIRSPGEEGDESDGSSQSTRDLGQERLAATLTIRRAPTPTIREMNPKSTDYNSDDKRDEREEHRLRRGFGKSEAGVFPVAADEGQERVQGSPDGEEDQDLQNGFPSGTF